MRDFSKRRGGNILYLLQSLAGVALMLVITFVAVRGAWGMYQKFSEAVDSDNLSQKQLATLQAQEAQVSASVDSFNSARGLEEQVRNRYGVVKPGEGQIQIVRDSTSTAPRSVPSPNIFIRTWQVLFGWI